MHFSLSSTERYFSESLSPSLAEVEKHPIFESLKNLKQLRLFMEHHVFAVWDFMSLLKFLQGRLAPVVVPWMPLPHGDLVRLINEIVLGEESDRFFKSIPNSSNYGSHFDLYLLAMKEVGASTSAIDAFLEVLRKEGLHAGLQHPLVPEASRLFMKDTFALLERGKAHEVAASFAFGRENVIPGMFQSLLNRLGIGKEKVPIFHYYLERHIQLDAEEHGPAALRLVSTLCEEDQDKIKESIIAAKEALLSRKTLWSNLHPLLEAANRN